MEQLYRLRDGCASEELRRGSESQGGTACGWRFWQCPKSFPRNWPAARHAALHAPLAGSKLRGDRMDSSGYDAGDRRTK